MPNGKAHSLACVVAAGGSGLLFYFGKLSNMLYSCDVMLGCLLGIFISPDLDLMENGNYSMAIIRRRSHFLAELWRLCWLPYAKLAHHRGLSHWPVIGTATRVLYIITWIMIITIILSPFGIRVPLYFEPFAPIIIGLMIADFVHTVLDVIF